jgi:hypothetical protein
MRYRVLFLSLVVILLGTWMLMGQGRPHSLKAELTGYEEVPASLSSPATGEFQAQVDSSETEFTYVLQYSGFTVPITQAHIHFGARATLGGISIWLCGTAALPGPPGTPLCPQGAGTVIRTVTAAQVVGPAGQGIAAGEFAEILDAMQAGVAYANIHTMTFPGGEIRGQIRGNVQP